MITQLKIFIRDYRSKFNLYINWNNTVYHILRESRWEKYQIKFHQKLHQRVWFFSLKLHTPIGFSNAFDPKSIEHHFSVSKIVSRNFQFLWIYNFPRNPRNPINHQDRNTLRKKNLYLRLLWQLSKIKTKIYCPQRSSKSKFARKTLILIEMTSNLKRF